MAAIRTFFQQRGLLEVETPTLMAVRMPETQIASLRIKDATGWLQSSPEYAMKMLLARGSGDIYQICKAFRKEQEGSLHRNEFTLVEWYRTSMSPDQLRVEVLALINNLLTLFAHSPLQLKELSYADAFLRQGLPDPWHITTAELTAIATQKLGLYQSRQPLNKAALLDLVFSRLVMPAFKDANILWAVIGYPANYAGFAKWANKIAQNFEIFWRGVELAHGYEEENDIALLMERFPANARQWKLLKNMPSCSGVALGFDRTLMLVLQHGSLDSVVFPY